MGRGDLYIIYSCYILHVGAGVVCRGEVSSEITNLDVFDTLHVGEGMAAW